MNCLLSIVVVQDKPLKKNRLSDSLVDVVAVQKLDTSISFLQFEAALLLLVAVPSCFFLRINGYFLVFYSIFYSSHAWDDSFPIFFPSSLLQKSNLVPILAEIQGFQ